MLVGSGRAFVSSTTSVSPTFASMVGPGTCPLYPYPDTTWPGAISHAVSAASSGLKSYVHRLLGAHHGRTHRSLPSAGARLSRRHPALATRLHSPPGRQGATTHRQPNIPAMLMLPAPASSAL